MLMRALIEQIKIEIAAIKRIPAPTSTVNSALVAELDDQLINELNQKLTSLDDGYRLNGDKKVTETELQPLAELVKSYADRVRHTDAHPTVAPYSYAYHVYLALAKKLSANLKEKFPTTADLLFYYVKTKKSTLTTRLLADTPMNKIFFTENDDGFVEVGESLQHYINSGKFIVTSSPVRRELTALELDRLQHHSAAATTCYAALTADGATTETKKAAMAAFFKVAKNSEYPLTHSYGADGAASLRKQLFPDTASLIAFMSKHCNKLNHVETQKFINQFLQGFEFAHLQALVLGDKSFDQVCSSKSCYAADDKLNRLYLWSLAELYWRGRAQGADYNTINVIGLRAVVNLGKYYLGVPDKDAKAQAVKLLEMFLLSPYRLDQFDDYLQSLPADSVSDAHVAALKNAKDALGKLFMYASKQPEFLANTVANEVAAETAPKVA